MATRVKARPKTTTAPTKRTKPRVEDTESSGNKAAKSAEHRQVRGQATPLDGGVAIVAQMSELVPVAQYANVTLGPVQLAWHFAGIDISKLIEVDWDAAEEPDDLVMTDEQADHYWRARKAIRATMAVIEHSIAYDRSLVEESVRLHNAREQDGKKR